MGWRYTLHDHEHGPRLRATPACTPDTRSTTNQHPLTLADTRSTTNRPRSNIFGTSPCTSLGTFRSEQTDSNTR